MSVEGRGGTRPGESGIDVHDYYTDPSVNIPPPGVYPFTRGISQETNEDRPWIIAQYAGFANADDAAQRIKQLIDKGQSGVYLALDLPSQLGYDPDDEQSAGEVGKVGVNLTSVEDVESLFALVDPTAVEQVRTTANGTGPIVLAMFIAYAERNGIDPSSFRVLLQNDVLKEYVARGCFLVPPEAGIRLSVDVVEHCAEHLPGWGGLSVAGPHIRNAGATPVEELGLVLSNVVAYLDEAGRRDIDLTRAAKTIDLLMCAQTPIFDEIAKLRAARQLWATILRERFGINDEEALKLRLNLFTSGFPLTAQQPLNNIVRIAIEALALVLSGGQVIGTSSFDEALGIPSEKAATVAIRTQQILMYECGLEAPVDPLGGSFYVEHLTEQTARRAREIIEEIDSRGGAVEAITDGFPQRLIGQSAYRYQKEVEEGSRVVVGVNQFQEEEQVETEAEIFRVDPESERTAVEHVQKLRSQRDESKVERALERLRRDAQSGKNVVPPLVQLMHADGTVGDAARVLREVFGEYQPAGSF